MKHFLSRASNYSHNIFRIVLVLKGGIILTLMRTPYLQEDPIFNKPPDLHTVFK